MHTSKESAVSLQPAARYEYTFLWPGWGRRSPSRCWTPPGGTSPEPEVSAAKARSRKARDKIRKTVVYSELRGESFRPIHFGAASAPTKNKKGGARWLPLFILRRNRIRSADRGAARGRTRTGSVHADHAGLIGEVHVLSGGGRGDGRSRN